MYALSLSVPFPFPVPFSFPFPLSLSRLLSLMLLLSLCLSLTLSHSLSLSLSPSLSLSLYLSLGHKNTNVPLILKVLKIIVLVWGKTCNGEFLGVFRGGLYLFYSKIALRCAQENLWVNKVSIPSKSPAKCPIISFAREKNNIPDFQNQWYINGSNPLGSAWPRNCKLKFALTLHSVFMHVE